MPGLWLCVTSRGKALNEVLPIAFSRMPGLSARALAVCICNGKTLSKVPPFAFSKVPGEMPGLWLYVTCRGRALSKTLPIAFSREPGLECQASGCE